MNPTGRLAPHRGAPSGVAPLGGTVRAMRVGALGGTSLLLAGGAHLAGGGRLPGPGTLLVTAVLLGLLAIVVTARRCRLPLLIGVLGVEQTVLHVVFAATGSTSTTGVGCLPAGHEHLAAVTASCLTGPGLTGTVAPAGMAMPSSPAMVVAHALAVVATAWLLARGEAWLWELADRVVRSAAVGLASAPTLVRLRTPIGVTPAFLTVPAALGSPRGPPSRAF